ncbi:MAG: hypothetical protein EBU54_15675 [Mycobacteriaceae bacterium]|nr:hypothetical protein [Mycobacteriaceae bacterium]
MARAAGRARVAGDLPDSVAVVFPATGPGSASLSASAGAAARIARPAPTANTPATVRTTMT